VKSGVFFFTTPYAESVVAADDMAFLDRLRRDWSPNHDATDDASGVTQGLHLVRECVTLR
jgi:hypothetical protein